MPLTAIPQIAQIPGLQAALDAKAALAAAAFTGAVSIGNGTVLASAPALTLSQTWNNAAVDFTAALVNVSNTASGSGSKLHDWQVAGVSKAWVDKNGTLYFSGGEYLGFNGSYLIPSRTIAGAFLGWGGAGIKFDAASGGGDCGITRNAAGCVEVNSGTAGQFRDLKLRTLKQTETMEIDDLGYTPAAVAGKAVLWVENNGSGKLQLLVRFPSGAPQLIKIEP